MGYFVEVVEYCFLGWCKFGLMSFEGCMLIYYFGEEGLFVIG